jgi:hypothetical protein
MRAALLREFTVVARQPTVAVAMVLTGVLLVGFILAWPHGMPVAPGVDSYQQTRALACLLFAVILPWVSMRAASPERGNALVLWSAFLDADASWIIAAKALARSMALALIVLAAFPALVMAQQAAAVPLARTAIDVVALEGVAILASGLATWCSLVVSGRLTGWLLATGVTMMVLAVSWDVTPELAFVGAISGLVGLAVTCAAAAWGRSSLLYLRSSND